MKNEKREEKKKKKKKVTLTFLPPSFKFNKIMGKREKKK